MTPLMFILTATAVLLLLVYWVISTLREDYPQPKRISYFETAPELGTFDKAISNSSRIPVQENELKLTRLNDINLLVQWNISPKKWQEKLAEINHPISEDNITLRVFQTSAGVKSFDIPVKTLFGSHDFYCKPETSYYVVLGILQGTFIPLIFSNTVIIPPSTDANDLL